MKTYANHFHTHAILILPHTLSLSYHFYQHTNS